MKASARVLAAVVLWIVTVALAFGRGVLGDGWLDAGVGALGAMVGIGAAIISFVAVSQVLSEIISGPSRQDASRGER